MKPTFRSPPRRVPVAVILAWLTTVGGCAALSPKTLPVGTSIDDARRMLVGLTGEYRLPGGGTRLEYAKGSFGRQTDMLDFDAGGRLVASRQVLTEWNLSTIAPGLPVADLRMRFGPPAQVFGVPWQKLHIWNYRYADGDCVWFQVSVSDLRQQVTQASIGTDPVCDGPEARS